MELNNPKLYREKSYTNGQFVWSVSQKTFPVFNPFNQEKIAEVVDWGNHETDQAIQKAHEAFHSWRQLTGMERSKILRHWYELLMENLEDLSKILTLEQGKPLSEAREEIEYGASFVEWFAEEAKRVYGDTIPGHQRDKRILVLKQPLGMVAAIMPWNFPNAMITRKVAPALAAGCTVVLKPSELTALSALALVVLAEEAGLPPGALHIITSKNAEGVGQESTGNLLVKKLSFTGSTSVGKLLLKQCAGTVKKLSLELGGNAPFIVFDDSDVDWAVEGAIASKYRNSGHTCVCTNRFFVQDRIYKEFTKKFTAAVKSLQVGDGMSKEVSIGPLIEEKLSGSWKKLWKMCGLNMAWMTILS